MKTFRLLTSVLVWLLFGSGFAYAQGVGSSGDLRGTVVDSSGAVLAHAKVIAVDTQTGLQRSATTDSSGQYRLTGLPPATYDVSIQVPGFETQVQKGVTVSVGQAASADFRLKVGEVSTAVTVTGEAPVIDTTQGKQADTISQQYITDLPIDRRDYLTFTLLAPGVSDATRLAGDQDFRVKQTPQSGLSFYGSNGRTRCRNSRSIAAIMERIWGRPPGPLSIL